MEEMVIKKNFESEVQFLLVILSSKRDLFYFSTQKMKLILIHKHQVFRYFQRLLLFQKNKLKKRNCEVL